MHGPRGQPLQVVGGVRRSNGIVRRVDENAPCAFRDGQVLPAIDVGPVTVFLVKRQRNHFRFAQFDHRSVADPCRRGHENGVAGSKQTLHRQVERVFCARRNDHFVWRHGEAVVASDFLGDRFPKLQETRRRRVLRVAVGHCFCGGALNRFRRIEIRLAGGEAHDVDALRLHACRQRGDFENRRRLYRFDPIGGFQHKRSFNLRSTCGGTSSLTLPPYARTSFTNVEFTKKWRSDAMRKSVSSSGYMRRFIVAI